MSEEETMNGRGDHRKVSKTVTTMVIAMSALVLGSCTLESFSQKSPMAVTPDKGYVNSKLEEGKKHLQQERYGLALESFKEAYAKAPSSVRILNAIGATYDNLGRSDLAEGYYKQALAIAPGSLQTMNNLGYSLMLQGRNSEALPFLAHAAKAGDPEGPSRVASRNYKLALKAAGNAMTEKIERASLPGPMASPASQEQCVVGPVWLERSGARVYTLITEPTAVAKVAMQQLSAGPGNGANCITAVRDVYGVVPRLAAEEQKAKDGSKNVDTIALPDKVISADKKGGTTAKLVEQTDRSPVIDVSNGAGRNELAARVRQFYESKGLSVDRITNAESFDHSTTVIFFRDGFEDVALRYAKALPIKPTLERADRMSTDLRIRLGSDILNFDSAKLQNDNKKLSFLADTWT